MAIRLTESKIPGGFQNARMLGQVNYEYPYNHSYVLISYLTSPLRIGFGKSFIRNRYVVFADDGADLNVTFNWKIELQKSSGTSTEPMESIDSNLGWYDFEYTEDFSAAESEPPNLQRIIVTVELNNGVVLNLEQEVSVLVSNIEELINSDQNETVYHTNVGTREITRLIANDYGQYINHSKLSGDFDAPVNFSVALLYLNVQKLNSGHFTESSFIEKKLNTKGITEFTDQVELEPIGLCPLKLHHLAMLPISSTETSGSDELVDPSIRSELESYYLDGHDNEQDYYNLYAAQLSNDIKIELYNLLRFPKSNILYCNLFLHHYKSLNSAWESIPKSELFGEKEVVTALISQLHHGPINNISIETTDLAARAFNISYSQYIQEITGVIPYQVIKIKVLDIRSGKPIKNAKVKTIRINFPTTQSTSEGLTENFPYENTKNYQNTDSLVLKSQKALDILGYDTKGPANAYGPDGRVAYKEYWDERIIDKSIEAVTTGDPPDNMLRLIVEEYESHRETDSSGILNIRIPIILLQGRAVSVEVGFYEFPIIMEDIGTTPVASSTPTSEFISRENTDEVATGFRISWIDDQNTDWDANVSLSSHFGWGVEDNNKQGVLRTAIKFAVKNNYDDFYELDNNLFSKFYDAVNYRYHFVVFGMQWCQPIWHQIPSTVTSYIEGLVNSGNPTRSIIESLRCSSFIATRYDAGGSITNPDSMSSGRGRDYGTFIDNTLVTNPRGGNRHDGLDYCAIDGVTPVFVPHGGVIKELRSRHTNPSSESNGYGEKISISVSNNRIILLGHLNRNPNVTTLSTKNEIVMAGKFVGAAGRTFNRGGLEFYVDGPTHLHLETMTGNQFPVLSVSNQYNTNVRYADSKNIVSQKHSVNRQIFLNNHERRLFPCDCDGGKGPAITCAVRGGNNGIRNGHALHISSHCWASRNLYCPYLHGRFRYKAQLTYLYEYQPTTDPSDAEYYLRPGNSEDSKIDDSWDDSARLAIERFRKIHRNEIYDPINNPEPPEGDSRWQNPPTDAETQLVLDLYAPHPRTDFTRPDQ